MEKNVLRRLGIFVRDTAQDNLGTNLYLLISDLTRRGSSVRKRVHLSNDERQLRGGKEERQLWERLTEMMEASARLGQNVDRSNERRPEPVT